MTELLRYVYLCSILDVKQEQHLAEDDGLELRLHHKQLGDGLQLRNQKETHVLTLDLGSLNLVSNPFLVRHCFVHVFVVNSDVLK